MEHCIESAYDSLVEKFEALIAGFNEKDQEIAKQWLEKLKNTQGDTKELKLRNEILGYFLQCSEVGKFGAEPFNVIPPKDETLYKQRWMLPQDHEFLCLSKDEDEEQENMWEELIQEAYSLMDDDDEFLSELPVPKSGVFCLVMLLPYEEDDLKK